MKQQNEEEHTAKTDQAKQLEALEDLVKMSVNDPVIPLEFTRREYL